MLHDAIEEPFLSKWFHKEPLTSEEPFCFTKGSLWRKNVLQIIKKREFFKEHLTEWFFHGVAVKNLLSTFTFKSVYYCREKKKIYTWSELLVPLVNMIKEGCGNKSALLILLIFYLKINK